MHENGTCTRVSYVDRHKRHLCSNPGIRLLYLSSVFFKGSEGTDVTMVMFLPKTQNKQNPKAQEHQGNQEP